MNLENYIDKKPLISELWNKKGMDDMKHKLKRKIDDSFFECL